jgi:hypothetical protein
VATFLECLGRVGFEDLDVDSSPAEVLGAIPDAGNDPAQAAGACLDQHPATLDHLGE